MDKDRQTISATELSKFEYCPYQWYYERLYGRNELRRLEKERNERLGLEDFRKERMEQGVNYHRSIYESKRRARRVVMLIMFIAVIIYFLWKGGVLL